MQQQLNNVNEKIKDSADAVDPRINLCKLYNVMYVFYKLYLF